MSGVTSNWNPWLKSTQTDSKRTQEQMAASIQTRAILLAPRLTGALKANGKIKTKGDTTSVTFGDSTVPYARIQELGGVTGRGYRTRIVGKHYLSKAGDSVAKMNIKTFTGMSK